MQLRTVKIKADNLDMLIEQQEARTEQNIVDEVHLKPSTTVIVLGNAHRQLAMFGPEIRSTYDKNRMAVKMLSLYDRVQNNSELVTSQDPGSVEVK